MSWCYKEFGRRGVLYSYGVNVRRVGSRVVGKLGGARHGSR